MILYDRHDDNFDVYDFSAEENDIKNFKKAQMSQIEKEERILCAETVTVPSFYEELPLFEYYSMSFNDNTISSEIADDTTRDFYGRYHALVQPPNYKLSKDLLLYLYFCGDLVNRNMVKIKYPNKIKYFLLKNQYYNCLLEVYGKRFSKMDDIIQLTHSLYLLQLLQQRKFKHLVDDGLDEILSLYRLSIINTISLEELEKMDMCGITQNASQTICETSKNDKYFFEYIMPKYKN